MIPLYIGIQGAAKRGLIAVCDNNGQIVGTKRTGPLTMVVNPNLREDLVRYVQSLCLAIPVSMDDLIRRVRGICVAMSGVYQDGDIYAARQILVDAGLVGEFEPVICEDVWAGLAAAGHNAGGITWASTGCNVFIRNEVGDRFVRVGGWGSDLADLGGGYYLGMRAINAILDNEDGRRPGSDQLRDEVLKSIGLLNVDQLVPWYYAVRDTPLWRGRIADIAIVVTRLAEIEKDFQAIDILYSGSQELALSLSAGIRCAARQRVFLEEESLPMVLEGGLLRYSTMYQRQIRGVLQHRHTSFITWKCESLRWHPVIGALCFAISGKKQLPADDMYHRVRDSAEKLHLHFPEVDND